MSEKTYIAIDLKSFYASVECTERGLDPMTTNLVVADESRTEKTICLAVSPSLKAYGIPGRARLFEVVQRVKQVNNQRQRDCRGFLLGESYDDNELKRDKSLAVHISSHLRRWHTIWKSVRRYTTSICDILLQKISTFIQ